jgi:hypothetical protein
MENKITQGNWEVSKNKTTVFNNVSDDPCRNFVIADCKQIGINAEQQEANAKLIAASKDLLEALQEMVKQTALRGYAGSTDYIKANEAINKALK